MDKDFANIYSLYKEGYNSVLYRQEDKNTKFAPFDATGGLSYNKNSIPMTQPGGQNPVPAPNTGISDEEVSIDGNMFIKKSQLDQFISSLKEKIISDFKVNIDYIEKSIDEYSDPDIITNNICQFLQDEYRKDISTLVKIRQQ